MHSRLFDHLNTAVLLLNAHLEVQYANVAAEQLFCHSQKHLKSAPFPMLFPNNSIDWRKIAQVLSEHAVLTDHEVEIEMGNRLSCISLHAAPFEYQGNVGLLLELRTNEEQNNLKQDNLQYNQQQAAHDLIRGLAHEIKNPLGGLRGAAQLLHHTLSDPELQEYTEMIISQADRLTELVNGLLGSQKPQLPESQNIHRVIERVHQLVECEYGAWLTIKRDYDPSLPDVELIPSHLEQSLLNLARNAAQALENQPNPTLILKTRTEHQVLLNGQQHALVARIDVIDNGQGIPLDQQAQIFYPSVSGRENGSGLGLTIAHRLVLESQGKLTVESRPHHTQFTIRLPFTRT